MKNKNIPLSILCSLVGSLAFLCASPSSTLQFVNGDSLTGSVVTIEKDVFSFQADALKQQTDFTRADILSLAFASGNNPTSHQSVDHLAVVTLEDRFYPKGERDQLKGELIGISDDFIELQTTYAGVLNIDRSLIYSLDISNQKRIVYSGPNSMEEWNELGAPSSWSYKNKSLLTGLNDSSLAIELEFSNRSHLSFKVDRKNNLDLSILLYADSAETESPGNYYDLTINSNYLNMRKYVEKGSSRGLDRITQSRSNSLGESIQFDIYSDLNSGEFFIYIDGEHMHSFSDPTPAAETMGNALHIRSHRGYEMRLRDITLSKWSGTIPIAHDKAKMSIDEEANRILLANGDSMAGDIANVSDNKLTMKTKHAEFAVQLSNINTIHLAAKEENHPRADTYDLKAHFHTGGWIILDPITMDAEQLTGNHEAIGDVTFDLKAFSKIEFNIYNRKLNKLREDTW